MGQARKYMCRWNERRAGEMGKSTDLSLDCVRYRILHLPFSPHRTDLLMLVLYSNRTNRSIQRYIGKETQEYIVR